MSDLLDIPELKEPLSVELPPAIQALRDKACRVQNGPARECVELAEIDARSWQQRGNKQSWPVWRGQRVYDRLTQMPLSLEPGELIVGKPLRRPVDEEHAGRRETARACMPEQFWTRGDNGHFHPDYETPFRVGLGGMLRDIDGRLDAENDAERRDFYRGCRRALRGMQAYVSRVADACAEAADEAPEGASEWPELERICRRLVTEPPATFHEAMQLMFLCEIALWFGEEHHLTSPGRMDQTLWPFYEGDRAAGRITPERALHLICCLYIQMNRILGAGSAVAVMVAGRSPDGTPVCNELTYLCLAARLATRLAYPTVGLAWHSEVPEALMDFAVKMLGTGVGCPAVFNDEVIAAGLRDHGVTPDDAHNYVNSTCVEIKVAGASHIWVTRPYFNLAQALLDVLDACAGENENAPESFDEFLSQVKTHLREVIREGAENGDANWRYREKNGGMPLGSCFIRDCIERGLDFDKGGARYQWVENSFVGLANLVDGLVAIRELVYDRQSLSLSEYRHVLETDYAEHEALRQEILNQLPKYGQSNPEADDIAKGMAHFIMTATESQQVGPHRFVPGFFCWIQHERMGRETGATPDGRRAGLPLANGAGAAQGRETRGPTASVLSTTCWDHQPVLGGLVHNVKFSERMFESARDRKAIRNVLETYLRRGGFEIQVNVASVELLRRAQAHPEEYRDLLVRVAGYTDYFVHLNEAMQEEVIARTEFDLNL